MNWLEALLIGGLFILMLAIAYLIITLAVKKPPRGPRGG